MQIAFPPALDLRIWLIGTGHDLLIRTQHGAISWSVWLCIERRTATVAELRRVLEQNVQSEVWDARNAPMPVELRRWLDRKYPIAPAANAAHSK